MLQSNSQQCVKDLAVCFSACCAGGAWGEHYWHSWAAIAKDRYYILSRGHDTNYTGTETIAACCDQIQSAFWQVSPRCL